MAQYYPFPAFPLPYPYVSLMPFNDADTLYAHHRYYSNGARALNHLTVRHNLLERSLEELISGELNLPPIPERNIRNLAGLIYNHWLYFDGISGEPASPSENALTEELVSTYGSMDQFQKLVMESAQSVIGSGWLWLIVENGSLHLATTQNNETVSLDAVTPVFIVDLWEHAYFPIHRFDLEAYLRYWFDRINWERAERRFLNAVQ